MIAGIRAGLYADETLAEYLLYRLNVLNPTSKQSLHSSMPSYPMLMFYPSTPLMKSDPAYLSILPANTTPITDANEFLDVLARRLSMLKRGGERDVERAAVWFVKWWREEGCALSASAPFLASDQVVYNSEESTLSHPTSTPDLNLPPSDRVEYSAESLDGLGTSDSHVQHGGWGFDFQWEIQPHELGVYRESGMESSNMEILVQRKMEEVVDGYIQRAEAESKDGGDVSATQVKKQEKALQKAKRERRVRELLARRRAG